MRTNGRMGPRSSRRRDGAPQFGRKIGCGDFCSEGGWRSATSCAALAAVIVAAWLAPNSTKSAVANGDTRTVSFTNQHTNEEGSFTYMVNGQYNQAVLDKLNWFMRDWRLNEPTKMDPHLFDIIWEVYREVGLPPADRGLVRLPLAADQRDVRRRSSQVAEHSQHMQGKAIDAHFDDVGTGRNPRHRHADASRRRRLLSAGRTWVHIDSGSVRYWPRMSREAFARIFPDGKTVFIPSDGQPMPGYDWPRPRSSSAAVRSRPRAAADCSPGCSAVAAAPMTRRRRAAAKPLLSRVAAAAAPRRRSTGGRWAPVEIAEAGPIAVAKAKRDLPTGPAYAGPAPTAPAAPTPTPAPQPEAKLQVVAALEEPKVESDASAETPSSLPDRSQPFFSRPCRRAARPISSSSSHCSPTFRCRRRGPPTSP